MSKLKQLIDDLNGMGIQPFIGYGNPDADILIVGQECGEEDKERLEKFVTHNFHQWSESFNGHGFGYKPKDYIVPYYDFEHGYFHPINPFYRLKNKKQTGKREVGRAPSTYYWYQRLIDKIRAKNIHITDSQKSPIIDFFNDSFITELSDICRYGRKDLSKDEHEEIRKHIEERFDWMRRTNFFNQFKIVILACGPYAKAIKKDEILRKELFGDAKVYYCNQLSRWDKKHLDDDIIPKILENP